MLDEVLTGVLAKYTVKGSHVENGKKENISESNI